MRFALRQIALQWSLVTMRHWRLAPCKSGLLIAILALGVAVFFSIRLANRAAVSGFSLFTENVTGASDLILSSPSGYLPVSQLPEIREALGELPAGLFPILEASATIHRPLSPSTSTPLLRVVGVDLAALPNLLYLSHSADFLPLDARETLSSGDEAAPDDPPAFFVTKARAELENWSPEQTVSLIFDGVVRPCLLRGLLPTSSPATSETLDLVVMDLPELQTLIGQTDALHRVEIRLPPGHWSDAWREETERRLQSASAGRWVIETPEQTRRSGQSMAQAFSLNLSILSVLALLVGVYLILQALDAAVVRRRPEIATLRALGLSPSAIRRAWQIESLAMGVAGTALGLLLGFGMAQFTVRAIGRTVDALYFRGTVEAAAWHWGEATLAGSLGLIASALAGWLPAREAAETPPARSLGRGARSDGLAFLSKPKLGVALVLLAGLAHLAPAWRDADGLATPWAGYLAAFLWVGGAGILAGQLFPGLARLGHRFSPHHPARFYAASQLREATGRHRLATAGLVVAVSMACGMSILIWSFESTVTRWLDQVMQADLFVTAPGTGNATHDQQLAPDLWETLWNDPDIFNGQISQSHRLRFENQWTRITGITVKLADERFEPIWLQRPPSAAWRSPGAAGSPAQGVMSEPFAHRFQRKVGDVIQVPTPSGPEALQIVGIVADYGNEFGNLVVAREVLQRWFDDDRARRLSVQLRPEADLQAVQSRWQNAHPGIVITDHRSLRGEALRLFHQTFAVTHGLKWIGIGVALAGLSLALASMFTERDQELTTLRALGLRRSDIGRAAAWESLGLAAAALVAGLTLGLVLGQLIIHVINRQAFGWTLLFRVPWFEFLLLGAGILLMAALTGHLTASRLLRRTSVEQDMAGARREA